MSTWPTPMTRNLSCEVRSISLINNLFFRNCQLLANFDRTYKAVWHKVRVRWLLWPRRCKFFSYFSFYASKLQKYDGRKTLLVQIITIIESIVSYPTWILDDANLAFLTKYFRLAVWRIRLNKTKKTKTLPELRRSEIRIFFFNFTCTLPRAPLIFPRQLKIPPLGDPCSHF